MKLKIQIPKGWRRLRAGEKIADSDMVVYWAKGPWDNAGTFIGCSITRKHYGIYIRRIAKKPRKGGAK